ncbi:MAG: head GIN domain-containing protein [Planctomycetota bacterium]|jgi:hypothetical protein
MPRVLPTGGPIPCFSAAERRGVPAHGLVIPTSLWLALLLLVTTSGCESVGPMQFGPVTSGSGNIISQARDVEPFQEVRMAGAANVVHVTATEAGCEIEADDNLLPLITTTVESGVLKIEFKGSVQPTQGVKIRLAGTPLRRFSLAGAGTFTTDQVDAEQFEFSASGAGNGKLSGQTKQLSIEVSGAGKVAAPALVADAATIEISGAGSADVHAVTTLRVSLSGAGSVTYSGNPQISKTISGAGGVRPVQRENPLAEKQAGQTK